MSTYIYDQAWEHERERLAGLEANLDPGTTRIIEALGIEPGWRCLEVGGGGGSITQWLCERTAPSGSVVATDLDPRFLLDIGAPNLEVRVHDIVTDPLEPDAFDLVHSRDVLEHLPAREEALAKMVAAVRPGGWIVVEDVDMAVPLFGGDGGFGVRPEAAALVAALYRAAPLFMRPRGIDPEFGRHLPRLLLERGLVDVDAEVRASFARGSRPGARMMKLALDQLGPAIVESGVMEADEVEELGRLLDAPEHYAFGPLHVAAWGRRPS